MKPPDSVQVHRPTGGDANAANEPQSVGSMAEAIRPGHDDDHKAFGSPAIIESSKREAAQEAPDPFDLERLRQPQDFENAIGVRKALLSVPVRKPSKETFVRVHPSPDFRVQAGIIELKETREIFWVTQELWPQLTGEPTFGPRLLVTAITRQGDLFLWPIRPSGNDGKSDSWNASAFEAAQRAKRAGSGWPPI